MHGQNHIKYILRLFRPSPSDFVVIVIYFKTTEVDLYVRRGTV